MIQSMSKESPTMPTPSAAGDRTSDSERDRRIFAMQFRELAQEFAAPARVSGRPGAIRAMLRSRRAGEMVIGAFRRGYLKGAKGLRELVMWAEEDGPVPHGLDQATPRCPENVFVEVCGNNRITARIVEGRAVSVSDEHGGLLQTAYPEMFPPSPFVRLCESATPD